MASANDVKQMELEGSLKAFKFPEILQFLTMGRMSGVLSVERDRHKVDLTFAEGKITGAVSDTRHLRLGQMLVYAGKLNRAKLDEALDAQQIGARGRRLGEILVDRKILSAEELHGFVRLQVEEEVWDLFRWEDGNFHFEQAPAAKPGAISIALDVEPLLLEGARRLDEWQSICANIDNSREVFRVNPEFQFNPELKLEPKSWRVLSLVNGRLSVEGLVRLSTIGRFETYWALDSLLRDEVIASVEEGDGAPHKNGTSPSGVAPVKAVETLVSDAENKARDGDAKPSLFGLFSRRKPDEGATTEDDEFDIGSFAGPSAKPYFTDVGLVSSAINNLVEVLAGLPGFNDESENGDWLGTAWNEFEECNPRADLVTYRGGRFRWNRFDAAVKAEGGLAHSIEGTRDDSLNALRLVLDHLRDRAADRLGKDKAAAICKKVLDPYNGCDVTTAHPEFTFRRWKEDEV